MRDSPAETREPTPAVWRMVSWNKCVCKWTFSKTVAFSHLFSNLIRPFVSCFKLNTEIKATLKWKETKFDVLFMRVTVLIFTEFNYGQGRHRSDEVFTDEEFTLTFHEAVELLVVWMMRSLRSCLWCLRLWLAPWQRVGGVEPTASRAAITLMAIKVCL